LMLLPNGPYEYELRKLVEELEPSAGAGDLTADNSQLLELVRFLKVRLGSNLRSSEAAWRRLELGFNDAPIVDEPLANFDDGRNRLQ